MEINVYIVQFVSDYTLHWENDAVFENRDHAEAYILQQKEIDPHFEFRIEEWRLR